MLTRALLMLALLATTAGANSPAAEISNLAAFARLYGYVRYFHPSDEAASTDWNRFAILGARTMRDAKDAGELRDRLERLFLPIAPTLVFFDEGDPVPGVDCPDETGDLKTIAWQHKGMGNLGIYQSGRTHRARAAASRSKFGTITRSVSALPHRGKEVRLRASVRVEGASGKAQLWLRVDRENKQRGFFDNMHDRPVTSDEWGTYEIVGEVADDAVAVFFGCFLHGDGTAWADDFEIAFREPGGEWEPASLDGMDFETDDAGRPPSHWGAGSPGYEFRVTGVEPFQGSRCVRLRRETTGGFIFPEHAEVGDAAVCELRDGLRCMVPLALYGDEKRTVCGESPHPPAELRENLAAIDKNEMNARHPDVRLAGVVIAWNVFQHFYPYFDVVDVDWNAELEKALARALEDESPEDFLFTLRRLVAALQDGHGNVNLMAMKTRGMIPVRLEWVEDRLVVVASDLDTVRRGDVLEAIDDVDAIALLEDEERYISGSPQWRRYRALRELATGPGGATVNWRLERDGESREVEVSYRGQGMPDAFERDDFRELEDGIWYVNLDNAPMDSIAAHIDELAAAPGVVFDLRGYPNSNHGVLQHLSDHPLNSARWTVPLLTRPDREGVTWDESDWTLPPAEPRFRGNVAFITDGRAISYAETFMGIVEFYRLGEIVGQPTAATNGNTNRFQLPGGYTVTFTGMRVLKHDGSQHHLVGIRPTIPARRTIAGVRAGRDELLETAIQAVSE